MAPPSGKQRPELEEAELRIAERFGPERLVEVRERRNALRAAAHQRIPPAPGSAWHASRLISAEERRVAEEDAERPLIERFDHEGFIAKLARWAAAGVAEAEAERRKGQEARSRTPFIPIPIRTARDAERNACALLAHLGFTRCEVTGSGPDGGVDVRGEGVVAQVKAEAKPVTLAVVQRTYGCAVAERAKAVVFGLNEFTKAAFDWAEQHGIALFAFDLAGTPTALNPAARTLAPTVRPVAR
jgi:hypothetical protein